MKKLLIILSLSLVGAVSCSKQEYKVYDNPYVYVVWDSDASLSESSTILAKANGAVRTYNIYLSSKKREEPVSVDYEIVHGDGLEKGVDFEVESEKGTVTFDPGTYVAGVSIKFLRHTVKKGNDNTVTILLTGASADINIGMPGAVPRNSFHTITKVN